VPTYEYEHEGDGCEFGKVFQVDQLISEDALKVCPSCGQPVERLIGPTFISKPTSDSSLRDKGFAKLVKRDKGVYENVTAMDGESRYWHADKPETMPNIQKRISD